MKPYQRKFTAEAKTLLRHMPPVVKPHIRALTDKLLTDPYSGKPLRRELEGYYSVTHTHYRIIYSINESRRWVIIEYVGWRKDIYELFTRYLESKKKDLKIV